MRHHHLLLIICLLIIQASYGQEFKVDHRIQIEKENPMKTYYPEAISMLDLLKIIEIQGIKINKIEFAKFDKSYNITLLSEKYNNGILTKTDTLSQFKSTYHYYEGGKPYYDFNDKLTIITKDDGAVSKLFIQGYDFKTEAIIELKQTNENSQFNWRSYRKTDWKLDKKIPLLIFASTWKDEKYGFERFCGVVHLKENEEGTNELLAFSPSYAIIYYQISEE